VKGNVRENALPRIGQTFGRGSTVHSSAPVVPISGSFGLVANHDAYWTLNKAVRGPSRTWIGISETNPQRNGKNEPSFRDLIARVLEDVLVGYGLDHLLLLRELKMQPEREEEDEGIVYPILDYSICLKLSKLPIGILAIKFPKHADMLRPSSFAPRQYGHVVECLQHLQTFHGVKDPIAILTDYVHWQVCWLPGSDALARSTNPLEVKELACPPRLTFDAFQPPKNLEKVEFNWSKTPPVPLSDLYVSEVVMNNDKDKIAPFLFSAIFKMCCSHLAAVDIREFYDRSYLVPGSKLDWKGSHFLMCADRLSFITPPSDTDKYALLHHLGSGNDDRVWLCSSQSGEVGVLKLMRVEDETMGELECKRWSIFLKRHHKWEVKLVKFNPEPGTAATLALLMPYVNTAADWHSTTWRDGMIDAIGMLADAGCKHTALQLHRFGFFFDENGKEQPMLLGLSHVQEVKDQVGFLLTTLFALSWFQTHSAGVVVDRTKLRPNKR